MNEVRYIQQNDIKKIDNKLAFNELLTFNVWFCMSSDTASSVINNQQTSYLKL